jgi:hypothetical protein
MISKLVVRIKKVPSRTFFLFYSHNNDWLTSKEIVPSLV